METAGGDGDKKKKGIRSTKEHPLSEISPGAAKELSDMPGAEVVVDADKGTVHVEIHPVGDDKNVPTEKPL